MVYGYKSSAGTSLVLPELAARGTVTHLHLLRKDAPFAEVQRR